MSTNPIQYGSIDVARSDLLEHRLLMAIDIGTTLTKVIFLHKDRKTQYFDKENKFVTLDHSLFKNEDLCEALSLLRAQAFVPDNTSYPIHITGTRASSNIDLIESILGLKTKYIDETLSVIAGHRLAFELIGLEQLISSSIEISKNNTIKSEFIDNFINSLTSKFINDQSYDDGMIFPCLINAYGSVSKLYYFGEDGKGELIGGTSSGGATFLGLAKCLLDTNNYNDIVELALKGNRGNVDTQVKDVLASDPGSPYGKLPSELPLFAFGKGMDFNTGLEDYAKEDVAMSLVAFMSKFVTTFSVHACQMKRTQRIYLTGNIFISNLFEKEIKESLQMFPFLRNIKFLDFSYYGAFGAMICDNSDRIKYCNN